MTNIFFAEQRCVTNCRNYILQRCITLSLFNNKARMRQMNFASNADGACIKYFVYFQVAAIVHCNFATRVTLIVIFILIIQHRQYTHFDDQCWEMGKR